MKNFYERASPITIKSKEERKKMKRLFIVGIVFILALSLAGSALAQEKAKKEEPTAVSKPATEKPAGAIKPEEAKGTEKAVEKKEVSAKPHIWRMGGLVTFVDPQGKTISIHQETVHHNWEKRLTVSDKVAKELLNIKAGDLVNIWVNGKVITALNKVT